MCNSDREGQAQRWRVRRRTGGARGGSALGLGREAETRTAGYLAGPVIRVMQVLSVMREAEAQTTGYPAGSIIRVMEPDDANAFDGH